MAGKVTGNVTGTIVNGERNAAFWRAVEKVMPDSEEQKGWLKLNGAGMSL